MLRPTIYLPSPLLKFLRRTEILRVSGDPDTPTREGELCGASA